MRALHRSMLKRVSLVAAPRREVHVYGFGDGTRSPGGVGRSAIKGMQGRVMGRGETCRTRAVAPRLITTCGQINAARKGGSRCRAGACPAGYRQACGCASTGHGRLRTRDRQRRRSSPAAYDPMLTSRWLHSRRLKVGKCGHPDRPHAEHDKERARPNCEPLRQRYQRTKRMLTTLEE